MEYLDIALNIIRKIEEKGFEAYIVGGFVRDFLLNIPSHDIDITTSAKPEDIKRIFSRTIDVGIKFGTVIVLEKSFEFQITTYRSDGEYSDNRHPNEIKLVNNLKEDIIRRDFTINAMCLDKDLKLIDLASGEDDLAGRLIRAIGEPDIRFSEDALRMLRAIRFAAKLNFEIEPTTWQSIQRQAALIQSISCERVIQEIEKTLDSEYYYKGMEILSKCNLLDYLPNLKLGVNRIKNQQIKLDKTAFFALCFYLDNDISSYWKFSNVEKRVILGVINLLFVMETDLLTPLNVYSFGLEIALKANLVGQVLGYKNQETLIKLIDQKLPIRKTCDLTFKGGDIMRLYQFDNASIIGDIVDDIKYQIIMNGLKNDYGVIKEYVEMKYNDKLRK